MKNIFTKTLCILFGLAIFVAGAAPSYAKSIVTPFDMGSIVVLSTLAATNSSNTQIFSMPHSGNYGGNIMSGSLLQGSYGIGAVNQNTAIGANVQQVITVVLPGGIDSIGEMLSK